jgi:hypothetical protein
MLINCVFLLYVNFKFDPEKAGYQQTQSNN